MTCWLSSDGMLQRGHTRQIKNKKDARYSINDKTTGRHKRQVHCSSAPRSSSHFHLDRSSHFLRSDNRTTHQKSRNTDHHCTDTRSAVSHTVRFLCYHTTPRHTSLCMGACFFSKPYFTIIINHRHYVHRDHHRHQRILNQNVVDGPCDRARLLLVRFRARDVCDVSNQIEIHPFYSALSFPGKR